MTFLSHDQAIRGGLRAHSLRCPAEYRRTMARDLATGPIVIHGAEHILAQPGRF